MNGLLWWFLQNTLAALLLIPCVMLACRMFRDRPAVQHLLWLVILLKFVTPPIVVWPWSVDELRSMAWSQESVVVLEPMTAEPNPEFIKPWTPPMKQTFVPSDFSPSLEPSPPLAVVPAVADIVPEAIQPTITLRWSTILAFTARSVWLIGAIACFVSQLRRIVRYARLVRIGEVAPLHLKSEVASVAALLRMEAPVSVVVKGITSPFLWCVGATRLAWPVSLASPTDVLRSRGIIAHELAHLRRRDHWVTWLELGASILWWWNPLFWFVRRQLRETAEMSCDALAIAANPEGRHDYAELLLQLSSQSRSGVPAPVLAVGPRTLASFERRLKMILSPRVSGKLSWKGALAMVVFAVIALPYWSLAQSNPEPNPNAITQNNPGDSTPKGSERAIVPPKTELTPAGNEVGQKTSSFKESPVVAIAQDSEEDENLKTPANSTGSGATLPPNIETLLDWGEAVDGLRGAVMIQTAVQKPELANRPSVFLVLQNVSDNTIRFCDTQMKKNDDVQVRDDKRTLYLRDADKGILHGLSSSGGTDTDIELQPREVVLIDQFYGEQANEKGLTLSAASVDVILHDPSLSYSASLNLVTAPADAWSGKLAAPATRGAILALGPLPQNTEAQRLFRYCIDYARLSGDIPGGTMKLLSEKVQYFIELNTGDQAGDPYAKKIQPIVARFNQAEDWSQADAAKLFDDIAAVTTIPFETTLDAIREHTLQRGQLLPTSLQNANWGEASRGGLRMAWILEPLADQYHLGSSLKSRVVIHNTGKEPVTFVTRSFHQPAHSAKNPAGAASQLESTFWTTIGRPEAYRLHPGECCEVYAPGIGIGRSSNEDDWANIRPGTWILASEGDEVVFQSGDVWLTGDHNQKVDPDWWLKFVTERLDREAPLPSSEQDRKHILFRTIQDLFGSSPTPEEAELFYADKSPEALQNLALLLSKRSWLTPVTGAIKSSPTKFKVLPPDPNAATRPRVAFNPGRYNIGDDLRLVVTRQRSGSRIVNAANLTWYPKGKDSVPTPIAIPDGYNTWAAGWLPGASHVWVATKDSLWRYDCSNPASIQRQQFDGEQQSSAPIPRELHAQLTAKIATGETPQPTPGPAAAPADDVEDDRADVSELLATLQARDRKFDNRSLKVELSWDELMSPKGEASSIRHNAIRFGDPDPFTPEGLPDNYEQPHRVQYLWTRHWQEAGVRNHPLKETLQNDIPKLPDTPDLQSQSQRKQISHPDSRLVVRQIRKLADDTTEAANAHVFESQKFLVVDDHEPLLTEADILLFGALMTQENDRDSHMTLVLSDESKATIAEAWNQEQTAGDASKQLGVFLDGDLLGIVTKFRFTEEGIRDSTLAMRLRTGDAVPLRQFLSKSCFHSPCQMRTASTAIDGVKLKARLLVQRGEDGKNHVVADNGLINSSSADRTLRIHVAGRESETRTLKPGESTHIYVPVDFGARSNQAGKFYVTPNIIPLDDAFQLVPTISLALDSRPESPVATTSPRVIVKVSRRYGR